MKSQTAELQSNSKLAGFNDCMQLLLDVGAPRPTDLGHIVAALIKVWLDTVPFINYLSHVASWVPKLFWTKSINWSLTTMNQVCQFTIYITSDFEIFYNISPTCRAERRLFILKWYVAMTRSQEICQRTHGNALWASPRIGAKMIGSPVQFHFSVATFFPFSNIFPTLWSDFSLLKRIYEITKFYSINWELLNFSFFVHFDTQFWRIKYKRLLMLRVPNSTIYWRI